jgi:hypothetical protein
MKRASLFAFLVAVVCPTTALADSDGYYCVGKGYLAFETRWSQASNAHTLTVIRVSRSGGIQRLAPIPLDDFQVHGITCRDTGVDLQGWSRRYSVDLSAGETPKVTSMAAAFDPKAALAQLNLGRLARPGVTDIPSDGIANEFQLVIAQTTRSTRGGTEYFTITQVFQRDFRNPAGPLLATVTLFAGAEAKGGELLAGRGGQRTKRK